jgi:hypothetical protein
MHEAFVHDVPDDARRPRATGEALGLGANPPLDQLAPLGEDADLAFLLVDVDANMVPGWPRLSAALTACVLLWGRICHWSVDSHGRGKVSAARLRMPFMSPTLGLAL